MKKRQMKKFCVKVYNNERRLCIYEWISNWLFEYGLKCYFGERTDYREAYENELCDMNNYLMQRHLSKKNLKKLYRHCKILYAHSRHIKKITSEMKFEFNHPEKACNLLIIDECSHLDDDEPKHRATSPNNDLDWRVINLTVLDESESTVSKN